MTFAIENTAQRAVVATCVMFAIIPTVAVALPLYARNVRQLPLECSDYCILVALVVGFKELEEDFHR